MSHPTLVLLWLGTSSSYLYLQSDLDAWARSRQVTLVSPQASVAVPLVYDASLVETLEQRLEQARILAASADEAGALALLAEVAADLERQPELPQAPWLMAERLRLEAHVRGAHPENAETAAELLRAAALLEQAPDGPRALPIRGTMPDDVVYVDARVASDSAALAPGLHHVRVVRRDTPISAGWITLSATSEAIELSLPEPPPCTRDDLGATRVVGTRVEVTRAVRCPSWAVARPRAGGGVEVATCRRAGCGPLLPWRRASGDPYVGPPQSVVREPQRWPLFVLAGASVLAATSIVLWQAGVFDRDTERATVFRVTGPEPEAGARP